MYRHGNTYAAHRQFQAAAANYDNASPAECADSDEFEQRFADAPASVRAELLWDFIDTPNRKITDLRADFMEYVAERGFADTDEVGDAIRLILRAMPWLKGSESAMADLEKAVKLLRGDA